ncbi:MAG: efflux RND transporter periplasmic adaptor subunit [Sphingomonadaceae bacterium]|nr:efflux RND transporter periplasmic adaptor subunit [Sphingomonadaceae bacterium]
MKPIPPLLALFALAACSGDGATENEVEPSALVRLAPAQAASVQATVTIYGTADAGASGTVILSAPQEAIVAAIDAPMGSAVGRGQVVARLAAGPSARLEAARAAADARTAQLAFARAQRLRADGLVGNAEVEAARSAAQSAAATLASLSQREAAMTLRAPTAGHVSAVTASLGSLVAAGTPVVSIVRAGNLRARFGVDPALARRIAPGASVRITPSGGGAAFTVAVLSVDPAVDPQTRLASVFVNLPAGAGIGAGEPLTGELGVATPGSALTIPYAALLDEGGQAYVFVVEGGVAHRRDVVAGPGDGRRVVIQSGLRAGETVAVEGVTAVEDGMHVRTR